MFHSEVMSDVWCFCFCFIILFTFSSYFVCAIGSFGKVFIVSFLFFNNCTVAIKSRYRFVAKTKIVMKLKIWKTSLESYAF